MNEIICNEKTWWCAYNDDLSVVHWGIAESSQHVATGQPHLDTYLSKELFLIGVADKIDTTNPDFLFILNNYSIQNKNDNQ